MRLLRKMFDFFKNDYLREIMIIMGVPSSVFNHADPLYIFFVFIFSSEIFLLLLSVLVWSGVLYVRSFIHGDVKSSSGVTRIEELGFSKHEYSDASHMKARYKADQSTGFWAVGVKGFILPILIIFAVIWVSVRLIL